MGIQTLHAQISCLSTRIKVLAWLLLSKLALDLGRSRIARVGRRFTHKESCNFRPTPLPSTCHSTPRGESRLF